MLDAGCGSGGQPLGFILFEADPKGPCTHIAYTLAAKYLRGTTLRPMYILFRYMDPKAT